MVSHFDYRLEKPDFVCIVSNCSVGIRFRRYLKRHYFRYHPSLIADVFEQETIWKYSKESCLNDDLDDLDYNIEDSEMLWTTCHLLLVFQAPRTSNHTLRLQLSTNIQPQTCTQQTIQIRHLNLRLNSSRLTPMVTQAGGSLVHHSLNQLQF